MSDESIEVEFTLRIADAIEDIERHIGDLRD